MRRLSVALLAVLVVVIIVVPPALAAPDGVDPVQPASLETSKRLSQALEWLLVMRGSPALRFMPEETRAIQAAWASNGTPSVDEVLALVRNAIVDNEAALNAEVNVPPAGPGDTRPVLPRYRETSTAAYDQTVTDHYESTIDLAKQVLGGRTRKPSGDRLEREFDQVQQDAEESLMRARLAWATRRLQRAADEGAFKWRPDRDPGGPVMYPMGHVESILGRFEAMLRMQRELRGTAGLASFDRALFAAQQAGGLVDLERAMALLRNAMARADVELRAATSGRTDDALASRIAEARERIDQIRWYQRIHAERLEGKPIDQAYWDARLLLARASITATERDLGGRIVQPPGRDVLRTFPKLVGAVQEATGAISNVRRRRGVREPGDGPFVSRLAEDEVARDAAIGDLITQIKAADRRLRAGRVPAGVPAMVRRHELSAASIGYVFAVLDVHLRNEPADPAERVVDQAWQTWSAALILALTERLHDNPGAATPSFHAVVASILNGYLHPPPGEPEVRPSVRPALVRAAELAEASAVAASAGASGQAGTPDAGAEQFKLHSDIGATMPVRKLVMLPVEPPRRRNRLGATSGDDEGDEPAAGAVGVPRQPQPDQPAGGRAVGPWEDDPGAEIVRAPERLTEPVRDSVTGSPTGSALPATSLGSAVARPGAPVAAPADPFAHVEITPVVVPSALVVPAGATRVPGNAVVRQPVAAPATSDALSALVPRGGQMPSGASVTDMAEADAGTVADADAVAVAVADVGDLSGWPGATMTTGAGLSILVAPGEPNEEPELASVAGLFKD